MGEIDITIDRRQISLKVDDGEESRIRELAESLTEQIKSLRKQTPGAADSNILLLTALILKNEVFEAQDRLREIEKSLAELREATQARDKVALETDARLAEQIANILQTIETLGVKAVPEVQN